MVYNYCIYFNKDFPCFSHQIPRWSGNYWDSFCYYYYFLKHIFPLVQIFQNMVLRGNSNLHHFPSQFSFIYSDLCLCLMLLLSAAAWRIDHRKTFLHLPLIQQAPNDFLHRFLSKAKRIFVQNIYYFIIIP